MLAFNELVLLRLCDDLRVWRLICTGLLFSDIFYVSSWPEWMGTDVFGGVPEDWGVIALTVPFVLVRLLILLGVGFKRK